MAMLVLQGDIEGVHLDAVAAELEQLGELGVSDVTVLRSGSTVAVVLQGWCFDPAVAARAAALVTPPGAKPDLRVLRPVAHIAVTTTGGSS